MKFSKRVADIDISGIRKMFEGAGPNSINLGLGQPDFDTPQNVKDAAISAINEGFTGYTQGTGIPELREAISNSTSFVSNPDEVIVTAGASEALHIAMEALVEDGDDVLVPDPGFVSYVALANMTGARAVGVSLNDNLVMDADTVSEAITPDTKVLIVNSPSNPTGGVNTKSEIKGLCEVAEDHNITIISDEVYDKFIYEGEHISPASYYDNVITINATSKTYAMTGWRLGWAVCNTDYLEQMLKVHQYVQACATSIAQKAAVEALTGPQDSVAMMRDEFKARRDFLMQRFSDMDIECVTPHGAFYAFPKVGDGVEASAKLLKAGVVTVPGNAFGNNADEFIRLSYATKMSDLERAMDIMEVTL